MKEVSTHEAKTHLSALLREVAQGRQVRILRGEVPVARLVPVDDSTRPTRPRAGTITSERISYAEGAFAALDDLEMQQWGLA